MKAVVALDSFKGSLDAPTASSIVAAAVHGAVPGVTTVLKPMADGGEGTARAMLTGLDGEWIPVPVSGPLDGMRVPAGYAWLTERGEAVVEMAAASGLVLLEPARRNPMLTTTCGTGELIRAAADRGARRIYLAVGGSATVDGGTGAARALGWRFLDARGVDVPEGGGGLTAIREIVPPANLDLPPVTVLSDVENPLLGPRGAAAVFGPQKGALPEQVIALENGLANLAEHARERCPADVGTIPGGGAAGGLAAGAVAFMGADIVSGAEAVMQTIGLPQALCDADWVITGEGKFDDQSLGGKVVSGVARLAQEHNVRVAVLAGTVRLTPDDWRRAGITVALGTKPDDLSLGEAMSKAGDLLERTAAKFAREYLR